MRLKLFCLFLLVGFSNSFGFGKAAAQNFPAGPTVSDYALLIGQSQATLQEQIVAWQLLPVDQEYYRCLEEQRLANGSLMIPDTVVTPEDKITFITILGIIGHNGHTALANQVLPRLILEFSHETLVGIHLIGPAEFCDQWLNEIAAATVWQEVLTAPDQAGDFCRGWRHQSKWCFLILDQWQLEGSWTLLYLFQPQRFRQ